MKIAVVGATGLVGRKVLEVLEERKFPVTELLPVASERSVGKKVNFGGKEYAVIAMQEALERCPQIALFSAGGQTSLHWAPLFAQVGTTVVDNSSAWRMDPEKKLIIPEINAQLLTSADKIIANPNCSTIQLLMAIAPLHRKYKINRLVVSTYQSVTGTGIKAVQQLQAEKDGEPVVDMAYPHPIFENCLPQCDVFTDNGYTKEEMKLVNETCKILGDDNIRVTATAVRVPVTGGHSESVNLEFEYEYDIEAVKEILEATPGLVVQDDVMNHLYPMPLTSHNKDEVFVGRIRRDYSREKCLNLWICADNLRKGAATNAVQIAEYLCMMRIGN